MADKVCNTNCRRWGPICALSSLGKYVVSAKMWRFPHAPGSALVGRLVIGGKDEKIEIERKVRSLQDKQGIS